MSDLQRQGTSDEATGSSVVDVSMPEMLEEIVDEEGKEPEHKFHELWLRAWGVEDWDYNIEHKIPWNVWWQIDDGGPGIWITDSATGDKNMLAYVQEHADSDPRCMKALLCYAAGQILS